LSWQVQLGMMKWVYLRFQDHNNQEIVHIGCIMKSPNQLSKELVGSGRVVDVLQMAYCMSCAGIILVLSSTRTPIFGLTWRKQVLGIWLFLQGMPAVDCRCFFNFHNMHPHCCSPSTSQLVLFKACLAVMFYFRANVGRGKIWNSQGATSEKKSS
jgi:hypothetical protein